CFGKMVCARSTAKGNVSGAWRVGERQILPLYGPCPMNFTRPITAFALAALLCPPIFAQDQPPLPQPRPEGLDEAEAAPEPGDGAEVSADRIYQAACPALLSGRIVGDMVPPIADGDCGLQSPIAVGALVVNGREIALSGAPVTNCAMATTLADWA